MGTTPSEDRVTAGTLRTAAGQRLPLEHTAVTARIAGPLADVEVRQAFRNTTGDAIEAVYLFPLAHAASVHALTFRIGGRTVRGVVREKEEARRTYERARAEGRAATLLEQDHPTLFTMSVANVLPGERVEVTLGYQERLAYDDGEFRFVVPLVAADRHETAPGTVPGTAPARAPRLAGAEGTPEAAAPTLEVAVELRAGVETAPPRCPSHRTSCASFGPGSYTVRLAEPGALPDRDFVLAWRVAAEAPRPLVHFDRRGDRPGDGPGDGPGDRPGTFLLAITPPQEAEPAPTAPRDVVFLVDRSASMRASLAQARRAVRFILEGLGPDDAAAVIAFDHDRVAPTLAPTLAPVTPAAIAGFDAFLADLAPRGGSEVEPALEAATGVAPWAGATGGRARPRLVVLVTDAAVGNEARLVRRVPEILGAAARLYVLGVGPAVHRYLVERLARAGGGASDVVLPGEDLDATLTRFRRRVRQGGPVLTGLRLEWPDAHVADVYPDPIPDLFGAQPVLLVGRYAGTGRSRLVLTGRTPSGGAFRHEEEVDLPARCDDHPGLEREWARLRIESRLDRLARHPGELAELRLEVLGLALRHGLLSPYTAFVAEDSEARTAAPPRRVDVAAPEVAGGAGAWGAAAGRAGGGDARAKRTKTYGGVAAPEAAVRESEATGAFAAPAADSTLAGIGMPPPDEDLLAEDEPAPAPAPMEPFPMMAAPAPAAPSPLRGPTAAMALPRGAFTGAPAAGGAPGGTLGGTSGGTLGRRGPPAPQATGVRRQEPERVEADPYPAELLAQAARRPIGALDLAFLVDETGSMGAYIEEVKRHVLHILAAIQAAPLCRSLRVGLVSYRDHPPQEYSFVSRVVGLTEDVAAIERGVQRMQAAGGGDGPEAVTDGLYDLVRLDWRPDAARAVVWIGDAPPHGVEPTGDGFPQGCPCGQHWYTQAENCREMGIVVHAVGCTPALLAYRGAEDVFRTVARTARGLFVPLGDAPRLIPFITGVAEGALDKQRIEESIAEAVARHRDELGPLAERDRLARLTEVLQQDRVRPRGLVFDPASARTALRFREITVEDVEEGIDRLRSKGRIDL